MKVSASNRKIIKRVCVCAVLLALVLWLVPLPLPFHMSLSGVRVEGAAAAARRARSRGLAAVPHPAHNGAAGVVRGGDRAGRENLEPVECLWETTFPDRPVRYAAGGWYDPGQTQSVGCALSTAPTARRLFSSSRTTGRNSGLCFPRTGATRRNDGLPAH